MLGYLEVYFIILIYSIILTILLKKRIEEVLPISIVEIVLIIYVFGLVNQLKLGIITIEILTIVQFLILLGIIIKNGKNIIHNILTPGLLIYTFLFFTSVIVNRNRIFEDYDEFNHWGLIVKNMFLYNTFGMNGREVVTFNEYPPFTAIFQYLFVMIQKIYKEDAIIIAHNILYFSIVIPITKTIKWNKNIIKMFVIIPVIIFLPLIFYENFYLDILVDGIIGIMFAYVIFSAFEKEENTKFKYLKILTGEIMLILTKTTSIALALLSITIIILEKIIFGLKLNKEKTKKEIKAIVIIFFIMVILISTWFLKMNGAKKRWDFQQIIKPESYSIKKVDTIFNKFIKEFFLNENITARKFTVFSIILLLVSIHIYNYKRIKTKEIKYYGLAMLINIVLWSFGMLFVYITIFDHKEAIELTCFERYISTILLANTTFQIFVMLSTDFKKCWSNLIIMLFILYTF